MKKQEETKTKAKEMEEKMEATLKQKVETMDSSDMNNNQGLTKGQGQLQGHIQGQDDIMKGDDIIYDITYPGIFAVKGNDALKRRDSCLFCGSLEHKLSPHLLSLQHRSEPEIQEIVAINAKTHEGSHRKTQLLQVLKHKGNFLHNKKVIQQQAGQFLPFQKFKPDQRDFDVTQFVPCQNCKGFVNIAGMNRHIIECPSKDVAFSSLKAMKIEQLEAISPKPLSPIPSPNQTMGPKPLSPIPSPNQTTTKSPNSSKDTSLSAPESSPKPKKPAQDTDFKLADDLISTTPQDEVSRVAKKDKLIRELSRMWADRHIGNRQLQPVYIFCMNRLLARFVLALRQLTNCPNKELQGLITPDNSQYMDPAIAKCFPLGRDVESDLRDLPYTIRLHTELKRLLSLQVGYVFIFLFKHFCYL